MRCLDAQVDGEWAANIAVLLWLAVPAVCFSTPVEHHPANPTLLRLGPLPGEGPGSGEHRNVLR